jgi:two-component system sensor histidine kinase QseC
MSLKNISLQTRITSLVLGCVLLFGLIAAYAGYKNALHESDEIFDAQLAHFAQNLMLVGSHIDTEDEKIEQTSPPILDFQKTMVFQVWSTESNHPKSLFRSSNMPVMARNKIPAEGFSDSVWQDEHWRYYRQLDSKHNIDVLVGENHKDRHELARQVAWYNIAPFLFGLPLLALFTMLAIYFGLQPLRKLTNTLRQLTPEHLNRILLPDTPKEIAPVVEALNNLLKRISSTLENERRFTADASHELRTPLAALHAQVQAAQLSPSEAERNESLVKALHGAERMAHLVSQLLTLSRLDEADTPIQLESVNLDKLTQECCAELGANALAKHIEISYSALTHPTLSGSADMLRILLRNLLDNAIRYTPQGGRVEVVLRLNEAHKIELEISDSGTGVAKEQLASLGQRFQRINPGLTEGVGLGLSIVQRIAEIHHAQISSSASLGGLSVKVDFQHA